MVVRVAFSLQVPARVQSCCIEELTQVAMIIQSSTPGALMRLNRTYMRRHTVKSEMAVRAAATPVMVGPMVGALGSAVL